MRYGSKPPSIVPWAVGLLALALAIWAIAAAVGPPPTGGPVATAEGARPDVCAVYRADFFRAVEDLTTAVRAMERRAMLDEEREREGER